MSVDITLPPGQVVIVPEGTNPAATAAALIAAAVALGLSPRVVRLAPEHGGFYAPAEVVDKMEEGGGGERPEPSTEAFVWMSAGYYKLAYVGAAYALYPGYDTFEVDWGDGTSSGPVDGGDPPYFQRFYDANGTYQVGLTVTDSTAALPPLGPFVEQVPVELPPPGGFRVSNGNGLRAYAELDSTIPDLVGGTWAWGDGTESPVAGVSTGHDYAAPGTYQVTMSLENSSGPMPPVTQPVTVWDDAGGAVLPNSFAVDNT